MRKEKQRKLHKKAQKETEAQNARGKEELEEADKLREKKEEEKKKENTTAEHEEAQEFEKNQA